MEPDLGTKATWRCETSAQTLALGQHLGAALRAELALGFTVTLHGPLGAGKTVLARGLAAGLGVSSRERIVSPTFTLAREYPLAQGTLHHLDAYRLDGEDAFVAAGLQDCCGTERVTCVEWGERVAEALPMDRLQMEMVLLDEACADPLDPAGPQAPRAVHAHALGARSRALLARLVASTASAQRHEWA